MKTFKIKLNTITKIYLSIIFLIFALILILQNIINSNIPIWPLFIIFTGIFLLYPYLEDKKQYNTIIPSLFLIFTGIYIFINTLTNWKFLGQTWPIFLLVVSFSLYIYYFAVKNKSLLVPSNMLILLFFILILITNIKSKFWALIFIIFSLIIIIETIINYKKR
ncbi:MAG: hypothetical protein N3A58_02920 [Spirochaetes bacterium]|nr:hypothetical protein [Spirochaetota bacterium]